ncbi:MAG: FHA domain-containing protein [Methylotenera sp.]|uniref:FHA domain-containing protein n=1 Tax=Methylotenera sp. TaxID=2051956 RepID=UPI0027176B48|nr:FHA domain-containing protein [Methylotenera sp.]MDO9151449.1 FHA domain-containing protein [Methylotenera sp.]
MAKLILTLDGSYLNEYTLSRPQTTIGRKSTNDIHLDNLAISGDHAVILKHGNDFFLEDLNSTNGTRLNNAAVRKQLLKNEDVIELGRFSLTFLDDATSNATVAFEKTMMVHPSVFSTKSHNSFSHSEQIKTSTSTAPNVATSHSSKMQSNEDHAKPTFIGKIQVLNGTSSGRELVLNKALTTLGKTGVQVAVITKRPDGYFITHVEGNILPVVNGVSTGVQARALADHDVIELAGVKMEFYLSNA